MAVKRHRTHYDVTAENRTDAAMRAVENNLNKVNNAASRMGQTFRAVVGATVAAGFTREMARAAIEAEKSQNRLTAVLRATGGVAGVARREIEALVDSLADNTLFDDDSIRNAAGELAKFGNIQGDVFREGLRLSADLAAFMGTDVSEAAQLVGKALQSPTEGMTALERQFGKLTEAQEENIKSLVAQGRAAEAQAAVLEILRGKVGGVAREMNTGLTKAIGDVGKQWNELMEALGKEGTVFNRTLGGASALLKDVRLELEGTRTPLSDLAQDSLNWLSTLRFLPGAIGAIGTAARNAQLQLDKQRRTVSGKIRNPALEDAAAFEAGLGSYRPIVLGGKTGDASGAAAAQREAVFRAEKAIELEEMAAQDSREAWEAYTKGRLEQEKELQEGREKAMKEWFASIDAEQERAIEQGQEYLEGLKAATDESERFGMAMTTAFDRAVRGGEDAIDVVKNLLKELAMVEIQKRIFEPASRNFSAGLDELLGGIFGGGDGGAAASAPQTDMDWAGAIGQGYATGTKFVPRDGLAYLHRGEAVLTANENARGGGVVINQTNNFASGMTAAQVEPLLRLNREQTKAEIENSLNRGSRRFASR